jgi:hypothetical protein
MNRRAIVTLARGPEHEELLELALPSFEAFGERHGYDVLVADIDSGRPASWDKVPALRAALAEYEEALWLDADTVIVDPSEDVPVDERAWQALVEHATGDGFVPNCGVWYVRAPMLPVLEQLWTMTGYLNHGWWEQAAMLELLGYRGRPVSRPVHANGLLLHTTFLDAGWNRHLWDTKPAEHVRIQHATVYPNRAETMRSWAEGIAA